MRLCECRGRLKLLPHAVERQAHATDAAMLNSAQFLDADTRRD